MTATSKENKSRSLCLNIGTVAWRKIFSPETAAHILDRFEGLEEINKPQEGNYFLAGPEVAEIMFTGWGAQPVGPEMLARFPNLKIVIHGAGSVKGVVTPEAVERGVRYCSAVHINARPVAEFCLGVILCDLKRVFRYRERYSRAGSTKEVWDTTHRIFDGGYYHKQVGLIGWGSISRYLARLLQSFDLDVYVASHYLTDEEAADYNVSPATIDWIMGNCDVISMHSADVPRNRHQVNRENLKRMKPGSCIINTARGNVIDEEALTEKLREGEIWAYLDVLQKEPIAQDHPLLSMPNCILTPHVSGSIGAETLRLGEYCLEELENYLAGRPLINEIKTVELSTRA